MPMLMLGIQNTLWKQVFTHKIVMKEILGIIKINRVIFEHYMDKVVPT